MKLKAITLTLCFVCTWVDNLIFAQHGNTAWTEKKLMNFWQENGLERHEGIYKCVTMGDNKHYAVKLNENLNIYELISLPDLRSRYKSIPKVVGFFKESKIIGVSDFWWIPDSKIIWHATFSDDKLTVFSDNEGKIIQVEYQKISYSTGTGFALCKEGYIATSYHVVKDAKCIIISGINGDFGKKYYAAIAEKDEVSDLAILLIIDVEFNSLFIPPYKISSTNELVGSKAFILGYPMVDLMGYEIKFTDGTISSSSGYEGLKSMYQTSIPVQPGNSGGPLFDMDGDIIGITCSKLEGAENVTYAVKSMELLKLIDKLNSYTTPKLTFSSLNTIKSLPTTSKIQELKKFVYIIDVR
jgi:S1-C subfamily serine protease